MNFNHSTKDFEDAVRNNRLLLKKLWLRGTNRRRLATPHTLKRSRMTLKMAALATIGF
jgi:hypothetical protein